MMAKINCYMPICPVSEMQGMHTAHVFQKWWGEIMGKSETPHKNVLLFVLSPRVLEAEVLSCIRTTVPRHFLDR